MGTKESDVIKTEHDFSDRVEARKGNLEWSSDPFNAFGRMHDAAIREATNKVLEPDEYDNSIERINKRFFDVQDQLTETIDLIREIEKDSKRTTKTYKTAIIICVCVIIGCVVVLLWK